MTSALHRTALLLLVACSPTEMGDDDPRDSGIGTDTGSETPLLEAGFETGLTESIGCTDTWLQVWDADARVAIEVYAPGLVADAGTTTKTRTVDLADLGAHTVNAVVADPIADNYCTDGLVQRSVHETWPATSGSMTLTLVPSTTTDPTATLALSNAVFALEGAERTVSEATFTDITVLTMWGG